MDSSRRMEQGDLKTRMISSLSESRVSMVSVVSTTVTSVLLDLTETDIVLKAEGKMIRPKRRKRLRKKSRRVMVTVEEGVLVASMNRAVSLVVDVNHVGLRVNFCDRGTRR